MNRSYTKTWNYIVRKKKIVVNEQIRFQKKDEQKKGL